MISELRNDTGVGLGWDVQLLEGGEVLFSKRCPREDDARFTAECFRQDYVRTGLGLDRRRYHGEEGMHRWVGSGVSANNLVNTATFSKTRPPALSSCATTTSREKRGR